MQPAQLGEQPLATELLWRANCLSLNSSPLFTSQDNNININIISHYTNSYCCCYPQNSLEFPLDTCRCARHRRLGQQKKPIIRCGTFIVTKSCYYCLSCCHRHHHQHHHHHNHKNHNWLLSNLTTPILNATATT